MRRTSTNARSENVVLDSIFTCLMAHVIGCA
jgi:hypothetical protein